ncbi:HRDC domain-containing protein [Paenibacillus oenotherae]|uniref:HRDC domain-containing protein n=1 Tax=Paenibacillus oenotherae TaxID=1435645 RepID=A0ABS7D3Q2_9BACL|nr:HRDC domain-containing protein [Paenibacillus oenotherae]MBW7474481.1 HRDC domain-containing protein [Paenibacillus oenotherae]
MNIVFLNTFEKVWAGESGAQAQLSICEEEGVWSVIWTEGQGEHGASGEQSIWFEGGSWEEMITAFRHGIAVQMGQGYVPLLDGMLDDRRIDNGKGNIFAMLQCYGEKNANPILFDSLREWRRTRAAADKKSAYLIATNRVLWMISAYVPQQLDELKQIPGWGETKQAAYGEDIIALTRTFQQTTSFPLDWVVEALDEHIFREWLLKQKENRYKQQMEKQQEKRALLGAIAAGRTLDELQAELELPRRELLERIERLDSEGYDLEPLIERELEHVPESEQQLVWDALIHVGDRYLKPLLHKVYGDESDVQGKPVDSLYDRLRLIRLRYRRTKGEAV